MKRTIAALASAASIVGLLGFATAASASPHPSTPAQVNLATVKGSNVGCTVTWTGHSIGQIGSYEAFTFTSTPPSTPSVIGSPPTAGTVAHPSASVHPGGSASSVEVLAPGTASATLTFHVVNNYGQQQTTVLTISTPGC